MTKEIFLEHDVVLHITSGREGTIVHINGTLALVEFNVNGETAVEEISTFWLKKTDS